MHIQFAAPPTVERFMCSDARRRMIAGPVGSGKSSGSVVEIARRAAQQMSDPRDGKRKTRFVVVRNTARELKDTTIKTFFDWFPPGVAGSWGETAMTFRLQMGDVDCEVLFRPLDTEDDVKRLLSLELTGAYVNEGREIPRAIYEGLDSRIGRYPSVRNGGCTWRGMWADTNMPEEHTYCYRVLEGLDIESGDPLPRGESNGWEAFVQPSGLSNEAENVENLDPGYYQNISAGKTEEWVAVYVLCRYGRSKGGKPVFSLFNRDLHVAKKILVPNKHLKLVLGADAGLTPAVVFMQRTLRGQLLILDECYHMNSGASRFIDQHLKPHIKLEGYEGFDVVVAGDPAMTQRSQSDEKTVKDVYKQKGFKIWTPHTNALAARINAVDTYLSGITEDGPAFLVSPKCRHLIRALEGGYRYPTRKDGRTTEDPEKNEWSHIAEAAEYGAMYHGDPAASKEKEERRKKILAQAASTAGAYSRRV
jgi:hypothetical protein